MNKKVLKILGMLIDEDQKSIKYFKNGLLSRSQLQKIQKENSLKIEEIVRKHGFPHQDITSKEIFIGTNSNNSAFSPKRPNQKNNKTSESEETKQKRITSLRLFRRSL